MTLDPNAALCRAAKSKASISMKTADQVREYVRRRWLQENSGGDAMTPEKRAAALAFGEVLNAFDTPHKTRLVMPPEIKSHWKTLGRRKKQYEK